MPRLNRTKLNDRLVKSYGPQKQRRDIRDSEVPGLTLRIMPSGAKSWTFIYSRPNAGPDARREEVRLTLGRYPEIQLQQARELARAQRVKIDTGVDPAAELRRKGYTFGEAAEAFLARCAERNRSWLDQKRMYAAELEPHWKSTPLARIEPEHVHELLTAIRTRVQDSGRRNSNGVRANRVRALARAIFNHARKFRRFTGDNPVALVDAPVVERPRDRHLSDDELRAVWKACDWIGYPYGPMVQLLILTGQRKGEANSMRWSEFDKINCEWTIPQTKNGRKQVVPLSAEAVELLSSVPRVLHGDYVFPAQHKPRKSADAVASAQPYTIVSALQSKLAEKARELWQQMQDQKPAEARASAFPYWTLHDLRHTVATRLASLDVSESVISRVLNHTPGSRQVTRRVYINHDYAKQMRAALDLWASRLRDIVNEAEPSHQTAQEAA